MKPWIDRDIWAAYGKYADGTEVRRVFPYPIYCSVSAEERAEKRIKKWLTEEIAKNHGECIEYSVKYSDCYLPETDGPEYDSHEEI